MDRAARVFQPQPASYLAKPEPSWTIAAVHFFETMLLALARVAILR
jgi:hypothetical protein